MAASRSSFCLAVLFVLAYFTAGAAFSGATGAPVVAKPTHSTAPAARPHAPATPTATTKRVPGAAPQAPPAPKLPPKDPRIATAEAFETRGDSIYALARVAPNTGPYLEGAKAEFKAGLDTLASLLTADPENWRPRVLRGRLMWKLERITNVRLSFSTSKGVMPYAEFSTAPLEELTQALELSHGDREAYAARGEFLSFTACERMLMFSKQGADIPGAVPDTSVQRFARLASHDLATMISIDSTACGAFEELAWLNFYAERFEAAAKFYARARDCGYAITPKTLEWLESHASDPVPSWSKYELPRSPDRAALEAWRAAH